MVYPFLCLFCCSCDFFFFFFNDAAPTEIYTLSLHDALPIWRPSGRSSETHYAAPTNRSARDVARRSEEHTSELQSRLHLVCRLLLEKKNQNADRSKIHHPLPGRVLPRYPAQPMHFFLLTVER